MLKTTCTFGLALLCPGSDTDISNGYAEAHQTAVTRTSRRALARVGSQLSAATSRCRQRQLMQALRAPHVKRQLSG